MGTNDLDELNKSKSVIIITGRDMSSFENTIVTWIFSVTVLILIFCILSIGMLIYDLLEIKEK